MGIDTHIDSTNSISQNIRNFVALTIEKAPLQQNFLQSSLKDISNEEKSHLSRYLDFCEHEGFDLAYMAKCYLTIVEDTMREQIYFLKKNEYRHSTFNEVANSVYFDDTYMEKYMIGLALTSFLWINHAAIHRFFVETLPSDKLGNYLEIGPGHGYNFMTAMSKGSFQNYLGIDLSHSSIELTKKVISFFLPDLKYKAKLEELDFLENNRLEIDSFDAIVMGEVLEHVEQPNLFLIKIAELIKKDGYIFVTTCLNSPAIDHIYLWRHPKELEDLIQSCGLTIIKSLYLPYSGLTLDETLEKKLALNVAYVLEKTG